jgi:hypothetical protein
MLNASARLYYRSLIRWGARNNESPHSLIHHKISAKIQIIDFFITSE